MNKKELLEEFLNDYNCFNKAPKTKFDIYVKRDAGPVIGIVISEWNELIIVAKHHPYYSAHDGSWKFKLEDPNSLVEARSILNRLCGAKI